MSTTTQTQQRIQSIASASDSPVPRGTVQSQITFFKDPEDGSVPYFYTFSPPPDGQPQSNVGSIVESINIQDIRGKESSFSLDKAGFATISSVPSDIRYDDWSNDEVIKEKYYPEIEKLLLDNVPGAKRIVLFDHTIRYSKPGASRGPVQRSHIDQTNKSAVQRVRNHMGDEAEELLKDRVRLINIWRPLKGPVKAFPLAMADSTSVTDADLVGVEHRYETFTGETAGVRHTDAQRWWYLSGMNTDERILLQCYDSHGGKARVAHTAFIDPRSPADEGRESIEVRALVFG